MIRLMVCLIVLALALRAWSNRAGDNAACAYAQQADLEAGRLPRACP